VEHNYQQAGTYIVTAEYWSSGLQEDPTLSFMHTQQVLDPALDIVRGIGSLSLQSHTPQPFDISGWMVQQEDHLFVFKSGTYLPSGVPVHVVDDVFGFEIDEQLPVWIRYPDSEIAYLVPVYVAPLEIVPVARTSEARESRRSAESVASVIVAAEEAQRERVVLTPQGAASVSKAALLPEGLWVLGGILTVLVGIILALIVRLERVGRREDEDSTPPIRVIYEEDELA
jgi:hypothetical protein